jgi:hypothetical protein
MGENEAEDLFEIDMDLLANLEDGADVGSLINENNKSQGKEPGDKEVDDDPLAIELADLENEELETDETENKTPESKGSPSSSQSASPPLLASLAQTLLEEGVLSSIDAEKVKEIKSAQDLIEVVKEQIRSSEFADLDENQKAYLEAIRAGVPPNIVEQHVNNTLIYNQITDEDIEGEPDLRAQLIKNEFLARGFSSEKADRLTKQSIDLGTDADDAKEALATLRAKDAADLKAKTEAAAKSKKDAQDAEKTKLETLKTTIQTKEEIVKGIKVNDQVKTKVFETLTKVVDHDEAGRPLNAVMKARKADPTDFDVKLAYIYHVTNGFTDFSKFGAVKETKAISTLEKHLQTGSSTVVSKDTPSVTRGILSALEKMQKS